MFRRLKLSAKLGLPVIVVGMLLVAVVAGVMLSTKRNNLESAGVITAASVANQVVTVRNYYTAEIASRAMKAGMALDYNFAERDNTLPLTATIVKALGEQLTKDHPGMVVRLYSRCPFPFRAATEKYDDFEKRALASLEKDPATPVHELSSVNGRMSMRYAVADIMKQACVDCHNNHPESPKKDWKVGDVRGAVEVIVPVDQVAAQMNAGTKALLIAVFSSLAGLLIIMTAIFRGQVLKPLRRMIGVLDTAAKENNLVERVPVKTNDEIGELGRWFNAFMDKLQIVISKVGSNTTVVAASSGQLNEASQQMSASAVQTSAQASVVSTAAAEVSQNLQTVATGTEGMTASIKEIASNATQAARIATEAVKAAETANTTMEKLGKSSMQIDQVVKTITSIARQTNLLALNATIEAARAGEAGKGFSVVAGEVKELANQTAKATEDIRQKIATIQGDAKNAVTAIETIGRVINQVNEISSTIASAVEEQNATTSEIAKNVSQAAAGSSEITKNIGGMADAAQNTSHGAGETQQAAEQLAKVSGELRELVEQFKY
jgi:methyl-accepting chemotaxis protein